MKFAAEAVAVWAACTTVGYGLTVVSPSARHFARRGYVWAWQHTPYHGYRIPDRFTDQPSPYQIIPPDEYPKSHTDRHRARSTRMQ
jgi:hypothetical protein